MRRLLTILTFLFIAQLFAQSKEDSLRLVYSTAISDSTKVKALHQLFDSYRDNAPGKALGAIREAIELSADNKYDQLEVISYNRYADYLRSQSQDDSALVVNQKALSLAKKINFAKGQSVALAGLGTSYARTGSFEEAQKYLDENLLLTTRLGDSLGKAATYMTLGAMKSQKIAYAEAMQLFTKASKIYQNAGDIRNYSRALGNIGFVYRSLGNLKKAESYLIESDSLARLINFQSQRAFSAYNLSIVYRKSGQLEKAITANSKAIQIYDELGDRKRVAFGQFTMGKIYWEKEDFEQALHYYQRSLEISKEVRDSVNIGHSYENVAKCHYQLKNYQKARQNLTLGLEIARRIQLDILAMNIHEILAQIYSDERNFKQAFNNMKSYALLRDSIYTKEKVDLASDIEEKYQNEQRLKEIALLESEKELQDLQLTKRLNERNGIIAFAVVLLILAALFYNQYRVKQRANKKLRDLDKLKSNFFANISHEFRTPLTLIQGPIAQLEQNPDENLSMTNIKMIRRNTSRVLKLVNQLLDLSRLDEGSLKLEPSEGDIYKVLRAAASSFSSYAAQRGIDYRVQIPQQVLWASFDRDKLEKVVYNLLSNAFKFSENEATIGLAAKFGEGELQIQVSDTGKGIPEDKLPFIFDRFFQVNSELTKDTEGSGIGLSLSKELVTFMDGTITASSELNKGSYFTVHLPIQEIKAPGAIETSTAILQESRKKKAPFELNRRDKRNLPKILLIEDNEDMRHFIVESLLNEYRIEEAIDGKIGLERAIAHPPQLIITDLMMPKMDGIELCKKLKTDVITSHVPVIMLTARAGMQNKIEGLETGADAYLTKPFNAKELRVRIKNLIEQRNELRKRYSNNSLQVDPKQVTVNSVDQKFLEQVLTLLEEHHADSSFGVPEMQQELAMSKSQLHRKLKALTNEAPGELLRNFRLKRAAQFLEQKADTVTQIAYKVGFNNLSYFAKCFKDLYGVAPSSY